jgi:hypothetical protein
MRDRVAEAPLQSLYHHCHEALLRPSFDDPEYRNDFALWARRSLRDVKLAERLSMIDVMDFDDLEERLSELSPMALPAAEHEFQFLRSQMVVFDTGWRATTPPDLLEIIPRISTGSIFFHFIEARRRNPEHVDDFSQWLGTWGESCAPVRDKLGAIDYFLWSLTELRERVMKSLEGLPRRDAPR